MTSRYSWQRTALLMAPLFACTPKAKPVKVEAKPAAVESEAIALTLTKTPPDLTGDWSACESSSSDTLRISGITHYHIEGSSRMTVSFRYFSDDKCQVPFGEADALKAIKTWETVYKETAGDDVKDYYRSLMEGFRQESTFEAQTVAAGQVGTFDQTANFETAFLSYKIVDGKLFLTEACLPSEIVSASETNCKIVGESASNRSTDFSAVVPFVKTVMAKL